MDIRLEPVGGRRVADTIYFNTFVDGMYRGEVTIYEKSAVSASYLDCSPIFIDIFIVPENYDYDKSRHCYKAMLNDEYQAMKKQKGIETIARTSFREAYFELHEKYSKTVLLDLSE